MLFWALLVMAGLDETLRVAPTTGDPVSRRLPLPPPVSAMTRLGSNSKALERRGQKCGERGGEDGNSGDIFLQVETT